MIAMSGAPTRGKGLIARVRRAAPGRYTLIFSDPDMPGQGRLFFAYSLRHVAELLKLHVPGWTWRAADRPAAVAA